MRNSERIERNRDNRYLEASEIDSMDDILADRIAALLNHPDIDKYCMVDAYYYDFSVIPRDKQEEFQLWRDCYLIFGITTLGNIVSKWVDRWDLDSDEPVVNGIVIKSEKPKNRFYPPPIKQTFNPMLLSVPMPSLRKDKGKNDH